MSEELPKGLSRPSTMGRLMLFIPKLAAFHPSLLTVLQHTLSVETSIRNASVTFWYPRMAVALVCVVWPLVTAIIFAAAHIDTMCRQWIWYRLLENGVVMNFQCSHLGLIGRITADKGAVYLLCSWMMLVANSLLNNHAVEITGSMVSMVMMHVFFVTEAESSVLPTINSVVKESFDENVELLRKCQLVPERTVAAVVLEPEVFGSSSLWQALAKECKAKSKCAPSDSGGAGSASPDHFWAMQLFGLAPISGILNKYRSLRMQHSREDYVFSMVARIWYMSFIAVAAVVQFSARGDDYYSSPQWFSAVVVALLMAPTFATVVSAVLAKRKQQ